MKAKNQTSCLARFLGGAVISVVPFVSFAAPPVDDLAYCKKLSDFYERYIGNSANTSPRKYGGTVGGQVAAAQCESRTSDSIVELERLITRAGYRLPARE